MASKMEILKAKVLKRIDEAAPLLSDGTIALYNIEDFIEDAAMQILLSAPLHCLPLTDFSNSVVTQNLDGSGRVPVPNGFVRLAEFRMNGWERPVNTVISVHSPLYSRQFNRLLRGGISKPVVAIVGNTFEYYSLPPCTQKHTIATAKCVTKTAAIDMPDHLIEVLCWLTVSLILMVTNESEAANVARNRYNEFIIGLYGNDTANN